MENTALSSEGQTNSLPQLPAYDRNMAGDESTASSINVTEKPISSGVARIEAIESQLRTYERYLLYFSIFLVGYTYGLDARMRNVYQAYATSSYSQHALLSTINVIRSVIAASIQPMVAKLTDVFGRLEIFIIAVVFYVVGTLVETFSTNVETFAAGALLYQIGYTCSILIMQITIADTTAMKTRVFFAYLPSASYLINTWVSGNIASAVLKASTWQWGIGMWAIIYPICCVPYVTVLVLADRRARKAGCRPPSFFHDQRFPQSVLQFMSEFDFIGTLLLTSILSMILIPLTLAGGHSDKWRTASIITPLVIGLILIPMFILWERRAAHPMIPYHLVTDRGVWAPIGAELFVNIGYAIQAGFLYTVLVVGFDFSVKTATRLSSIYSFASVLTGITLGVIISRVRRLKPFFFIGSAIWFLGFGLLVQYRGGINSTSRSGVVAGQIVLGIGGGHFSYTSLIAVQARAKHVHVAIITSLMLTFNNIGAALGSCISGAIWTQTLYQKLQEDLAGFGNDTLASTVYASPFTVVPTFAGGTSERTAIVGSYMYIQKLLTVCGLCLAVPVLVFSFFTRNPRLSDEITQPGAESSIGT